MKARYLVRAISSAAALLVTTSFAGAQVSDGVVKIGVLTDMTGLYSDLSGRGSVAAAQMAVEDFGGKVMGKRIEVVAADHQNKPDVGASIARRWFDLERVDAIADVPTSSVAFAVQEIARQKNRALLISSSGSSDLTGKACSPFSVHWTYDTYALSHAVGNALLKRGADTWFFLTADYAFGLALEKVLEQWSRPAAARFWEAFAIRRTLQISLLFSCRRKDRRRRLSLSRTREETLLTL